jgi:hypothetical protein
MAFDKMTQRSQSGAIGGEAGGATPGKRTLTESLSESLYDMRGSGTTVSASLDARGGAGAGGGAVEDTRPEAGVDGGTNGDAGVGGGGGAAIPTPVAVRNGPTHAPIDAGDRVGMSIAIAITSSTGRDADMARIQDSEQVSLSYNHTGSCNSMAPLPSNQSGFMAGHPIPDDQHGWSRATVLDLADNHGGNGSFEKSQLDIYTDAAAGVTTAVAIPHSGYIIKRIITKGAGMAVSFRTEKRPARVTVNGFTSDAGPSAAQHDDVVARG